MQTKLIKHTMSFFARCAMSELPYRFLHQASYRLCILLERIGPPAGNVLSVSWKHGSISRDNYGENGLRNIKGPVVFWISDAVVGSSST